MANDEETRQLLSSVSDGLSALPNVVGVGVVEHADSASEAAIAVYVRSKIPKDQLKPEDIIPETVNGVVDGVAVEAPTKVIEVGEFKI